jgi:hypothetical protein
MKILEEIRKSKISTNWFIKGDDWFCFSDGFLYTQDKTKSGPESIVEVTDENSYDDTLSYYRTKN